MQDIHHFIVVGANGTVAKALVAQILQNPAHRVLVTTHTLSDLYKQAAEKDPARLRYCAGFDPLDKQSLCRFRDTVETFAGDARYAVIMPIGHFVAHKPGIFHTLDENRDILNINYVAPANIMQTLLPHMLNTAGGHFVAFSCQSTQRNDPFMGAFTAAKSALESLVKTNANEYGGAQNPVIFNAVRVASVLTDLTVSLKPNGDVANYIPPEEVAAAALALVASPQSLNRNGSIDNAFRYSKTFFLDGPLNRIACDENAAAIKAWQAGFAAKTGYPPL